ncbi:MAG TPA: DUF3131 domain-containing protein [Longimicrobiales bacterium]
MSKLAIVLAGGVVLAGASVATLAFDRSSPTPKVAVVAPIDNRPPSYVPRILTEPSGVDVATEQRAFDEAARSAWAFIEAGHIAGTGLTVAQTTWAYPTVWDIASTLAAYYAGRGLGFISEDEYRRRTLRALQTLERARLYNNVAYGRNYDAKTGDLVGHDQKPSINGTGYSAIDLGRLLVWLKIVSQDNPELAAAAQRVAGRINASHVVRNGYMHGETVAKDASVAKYQEGRLGYEQYAAHGFQLWGMKADRAARAAHNARKVVVQGLPMTADRRKLDRITSEPFILHGLEIGLDGEMKEMAWQTLAQQAQRYSKTGIMTMASEDALNVKPYYFYYYCVYCSGKEFVINVHSPGTDLDEPRWLSTKAAFAWHALLPSKYTWSAIDAVRPAHVPGKGWASGVFEKSGKSTEVLSLNTAAVILEAALYRKTGKPFLKS